MSDARRSTRAWPHSRMALAWGLGISLAACSASEANTRQPTPAPEDRTPTTDDPVDAAIEAHWAAAGVTPTAAADDAEYLRRLSLDLIGRIPTPDEVERFMADSDPQKRAALVDDLLARDEFAEHWADVLTETLLGGAVNDRRRLHEGLHTWLTAQLHEGRGWDEMTTQMLTTEGVAEVEGPAAFLVVHGRQNQVEALTGQTARVFLGLQLQCAQCHDDPDDRFTQQEFYGLAAYYARTRARFKKVDGVRVPNVVDKRRGEMRMPTDYDAPGDRSGPRVEPQFSALSVDPLPDESRRQTLARGIVESELFARAAVNHAWAQMMGRGIVEPWDDLGAPDGSDHPPLLTLMAKELRDHDYDLRYLLRRIALSTAYQRSSQGPEDGALAKERAFAQAALRPMTSSQLLRSLLVATGLNDVQGRAFRREVKARRQKLRREYALVFDDDEMGSVDSLSGNVPQALLLLNGELTNQGVAASHGSLNEILREHDETGDRIDALYVRVYGRRPEPERKAALTAFVDARGPGSKAYQDLMHAMLVSSEFVTVH